MADQQSAAAAAAAAAEKDAAQNEELPFISPSLREQLFMFVRSRLQSDVTRIEMAFPFIWTWGTDAQLSWSASGRIECTGVHKKQLQALITGFAYNTGAQVSCWRALQVRNIASLHHLGALPWIVSDETEFSKCLHRASEFDVREPHFTERAVTYKMRWKSDLCAWNFATHAHFGDTFKQQVFTVLCARLRSTDCDDGLGLITAIPGPSKLLQMPIEIWKHIFSFLAPRFLDHEFEVTWVRGKRGIYISLPMVHDAWEEACFVEYGDIMERYNPGMIGEVRHIVVDSGRSSADHMSLEEVLSRVSSPTKFMDAAQGLPHPAHPTEDEREIDICSQLLEHMDIAVDSGHGSQSRAQPPAECEIPSPFGTFRLSLQTSPQGLFWPSASETQGFSDLPLDIKLCCEQLAASCDYIGNYVGYDCSTGSVCVFQHGFESMRLVLDQKSYPLKIVSVDTYYQGASPGVLDPAMEAHILDVIARHQDVLLAPNVVLSHPSATKRVGGTLENTPCIRVIVFAKGKIPLGSWIIPRELEGIPLDVMEGPPLNFQHSQLSIDLARRSRNPVMFTGEHIETTGLDGDYGGTFGAVVTPDAGATLLGLTCGHTFDSIGQQVRRGRDDIGKSSRILTPTTYDPLPALTPDILHDGTKRNVKADFGLFTLDDPKNATTRLNPDLRGPWKDLAFPDPFPIAMQPARGRGLGNGTVVYKQGGASGLTMGTTARAFVQIHMPSVINGRYYVCSCQSICIAPQSDAYFSRSGDSGSLVFSVSESGVASIVGLLYAGAELPRSWWPKLKEFVGIGKTTTCYTVAGCIEDLQEEMGVEIVTCENPRRLVIIF